MSFNEKQSLFFLNAVHATSIRKAAEQMGVEASTISRQIASLEKTLDTNLIERGRKGIKLTQAGSLFYDYLIQNEAKVEQLKSDIHAINGLEKGVVHLAVGEGFVGDLVRSSLKEFHQKHPKIEFKINFGSTNKIIRQILNDEAHIGLAYNVPMERGIRIVTEMDQALKLVVQADSVILQDFEREGIACLEKYSAALLKNGLAVGSLIRNAIHKHELNIHTLIETDSIAVLKDFVKEDLGFSFLPEFAVAREISEGKLVAKDVGIAEFAQGSTALITRSGRQLPEIAYLFSNHLKQNLKH